MTKNVITKKRMINPRLMYVPLILSIFFNIGLLYELSYQEYQHDLQIAVATATNYAHDYCNLKRAASDQEIEGMLKSIKPLSNALFEDYEGRKTLYISYMDKSRFSQNWADSRYSVRDCN